MNENNKFRARPGFFLWFSIGSLILFLVQVIFLRLGYALVVFFFHIPSLVVVFAAAYIEQLGGLNADRENDDALGGKIYRAQVLMLFMGMSIFLYFMVILFFGK